jgi:hypothetical protein
MNYSRHSLFIIIFTTVSLFTQSQNLVPCFSDADKVRGRQWGFCDKFFSATSIKCQFDTTLPFSDGLARIRQNGKYGFIDNTGKLIIPSIYESAEAFSEGFAAIKLNGKISYIDKKGADVFKKTFTKGFPFTEGLAIVANEEGKYGFINNKGIIVISFDYTRAHSFNHGIAPVLQTGETIWKTIDTKGKTIFTFNSNINYARSSFKEGLVDVYRRDDKDSHFDFVNEKGEYITNAPYLEIKPFRSGRAIVMKKTPARSKQSYLYGLITKSGNEIVPATYVCLEESPIDGIYFYGTPATSGYGCSGYGLMDSLGNIITQPKFSSFTKLNDTTFLCKETDRISLIRYLLLTTKGKELLTKRQYNSEFTIAGTDTLVTLFSDFGGGTLSFSVYNIHTGVLKDNSTDGIFIYKKQKLVLSLSSGYAGGAVMTTAGKMLVDNVEIQTIYDYNEEKENAPFILLKKAGETGFRLFNLNTGKYTPDNYDFGSRAYQYSNRFSEGMLAVKQKDKWGFIDSTGKLKIPAIYDNVKDFHNGWAVAQLKTASGKSSSPMVYINKAGKEIPGIKADFLKADGFSEGIAYYIKYDEPGKNIDQSVCYINTAGKLLYKSEAGDFYKHGQFSNGMAAVSNKEGKYGFINTKGELVIPCQYSIPKKEKDEDDEDDNKDKEAYVGYLEYKINGQVAVMKDGKKIWIDKTGKVIR